MKRCCRQITGVFINEVAENKDQNPFMEECDESKWSYLMKLAEDYEDKEVENT